MRFLLKIILSALSISIITRFLPGVSIEGHDLLTALLVSITLAFLNAVVKPILAFLTVPITILTLGLFYLVLNTAMILLASRIVNGFYISGFKAAFIFSIILSLVTWILEKITGARDRKNEN